MIFNELVAIVCARAPWNVQKGQLGAAHSAQETTSGADGLYRPNNTRTLVRNPSKGSSIQSIYPRPHTGVSSENNSPSIHFTVDKADQNMMLIYTKHYISTCLADLEMIDTYSVVPPMVKMDDYKYSCPVGSPQWVRRRFKKRIIVLHSRCQTLQPSSLAYAPDKNCAKVF